MTPKAPSLIDFKNPSIRTLHFTWLAFFLTFVVWFNMAGVLSEMIKQFDWLTKANVKALLVTNVALTIPARIIVGGLIDKYGPRRIFAGLMVIMVIPGLTFAFGDNLTQLVVSRLALGAIGAGFVIGIKMTANWFTPKYIGRAEGFYAGWGNFGSAAAAALVPFVAVNLLGGDWRWSLAITSIVAAIYGVIYFMIVKDYPEGQEPSADKKKGGPMPVSSYLDLGQYLLWELPLYGALGLVAFVLHKQMIHGEHMISMNIVIGIWIALFIVYLADVMRILKTNLPRLKAGVPDAEKFPFGSVGALNSTYFANFGAELAIVSMLPMFFYEVFSGLLYADGSQVMTLTLAGAVAGSFAFMNLVARPLGGLLSDKMGSRKKTMLLYMSGITIGFFLMAMISKYGPMGADGEVSLLPQFNSMGWLIVSVVITMFASFFVQGAEGATFAMIPSIKKEMTGRIAGMAGAFGNVGAVTYLFLYTFMDDKTFLYMLSGGAFISLVYCFFMLKEPKDAFADSF
ncbi:MAG: MFS transporter [Bacteroidetes bacterium]|jgi:MFS transporter, NNP family, nitrate/nitrite transporter|nr:MFS transporter [Bacteroidota bacterium]MBT3799562.1 MFS transporter [Bacteroidota bacterium]MBT4338814.1 MFS transporter [Bacteroidota bacterium]MBT4968132.1 MFS transporter [Bacteroidota bacterium]MBT7825500.1 MFS transporter [Bacteroidota bacterium]